MFNGNSARRYGGEKNAPLLRGTADPSGTVDNGSRSSRRAASAGSQGPEHAGFQILVNTHSPVVMSALKDHEVVASDVVSTLTPENQSRTSRTRMRSGVYSDPEKGLTRSEVEDILRRHVETA